MKIALIDKSILLIFNNITLSFAIFFCELGFLMNENINSCLCAYVFTDK